jgi:prepilin-type N-terminal cleavage/methylation domain-containing protein
MIEIPSPRLRRRAFTLIELLVVMGIVLILIGILFPMVGRMMADAKKKKTQAEMGVIQTALEEYKKDHGGRYPNATSEGLNAGFAVLARELVGIYGDGYLPGTPPTPDPNDPAGAVAGKAYMPGDAVSTGGGNSSVCMFDLIKTSQTGAAVTNNAVWVVNFRANDGADGPGTTITGAPGSKKVAYIPPDKFRVRGCALLDAQDNPILYFVARGNPNINKGINNNPGSPSYFAPGAVGCKFDANDNVQFFCRQGDADIATTRATAVRRIQAMAGDFEANPSGGAPPATSFNGIIDGTESAVAGPSAAYILWAPGPDSFYGPNASANDLATDSIKVKRTIDKCDDILLTP